jgi:hypothetical protein
MPNATTIATATQISNACVTFDVNFDFIWPSGNLRSRYTMQRSKSRRTCSTKKRHPSTPELKPFATLRLSGRAFQVNGVSVKHRTRIVNEQGPDHLFAPYVREHLVSAAQIRGSLTAIVCVAGNEMNETALQHLICA